MRENCVPGTTKSVPVSDAVSVVTGSGFLRWVENVFFLISRAMSPCNTENSEYDIKFLV